MTQYLIRVSPTNIEIVSEKGEELPQNRIRWLMDCLNERYPKMAYVYIAEHHHEPNLYKIGVSERPQRRETQIDGLMIRQYQCERKYAYELEADLHRLFKDIGYHHKHEWFWLKDDSYDFISHLPEGDSGYLLVAWGIICLATWAKDAILSHSEYTEEEKECYLDQIANRLRGLATEIRRTE